MEVLFKESELEKFWDDIYGMFIDYEICSQETLDVVRYIEGKSMDVFYDILYPLYGLRSLEQVAMDDEAVCEFLNELTGHSSEED
jgi:hypothetical protein